MIGDWRLEIRDWRLQIGLERLTDFGVGKFPVSFGYYTRNTEIPA